MLVRTLKAMGRGAKYKRKGGWSTDEPKRARTEPEVPAEAAAEAAGEAGDAGRRIPKRKVALIFGYAGTNYCGLQRNPGVKTVEDDLESALFAAGGIMASNYGELQKIGWTRAARTDKGVHAVGQCVSLKATIEGTNADFVTRVNQHLPADVRIFGCKKVVKSFHAKQHASARRYEYLLPSAALATVEGSVERENFENIVAQYRHVDTESHADTLVAFSRVLQLFNGTHNYHNFTARRAASDPSTKRHVISFEVVAPEVFDGVEYLRLMVEGQSFMLHQIRKMVGLAVWIVRTRAAPSEIFSKAFSLQKLNLPIAPAAGLLLQQVLYSRYDERFVGDPEEERESLMMDAEKPQMEAFKREQIYSRIIAVERDTHETAHWLHHLDTDADMYLQPSDAPSSPKDRRARDDADSD
jgi:tRNA pseudouridine38-40 synthase